MVRYADMLIEAGNPEAISPDLRWPPRANPTRPPDNPRITRPPSLRWPGRSGTRWAGNVRTTLIRNWSEVPDVAEFKQQMFVAEFGVFDLLWFGLAAFTAFGLGSNSVGGDD